MEKGRHVYLLCRRGGVCSSGGGERCAKATDKSEAQLSLMTFSDGRATTQATSADGEGVKRVLCQRGSPDLCCATCLGVACRTVWDARAIVSGRVDFVFSSRVIDSLIAN